MSQLFISHASSDHAWVREFTNALHNLGVGVWYGESDIALGDSIVDKLEKALRESEIIILPITRETINNPNFQFELGAALGMNKRIVPIVSDDVDKSQLPLALSRLRALKQRSPQETAKELVEALKIPHDEAA